MFKKIKQLFKDRNKIQFKILKYFTVFSLIIITVLWLFQIVNLRYFYRYMTIKNINKTADTIEENIDNDQLYLLIKRLAINNDFSIRLFSLDDNKIDISIDNNEFSILLSSLSYLDLMNYYSLTLKNNGQYTLIIEKSTFYNDLYQSDSFKGDVPKELTGFDDHVVFSKVIYDNDQPYLFLGYAQLAPVYATIDILKTQLVIVSSIFMLLTIIFTIFISKRISKPIIDINEQAKKLAEGNYHLNFDNTGYLEINELSSTLNHTASELKKVDELKNELIANISHDLKTPLTLIAGYSEAMIDLPQEMTKENIQIILNEANRLSQLVDDVLTISQVNNSNLNIEEYEITKDIKNIIDRYQRIYFDKFKFEFSYDKDITISADKIKIDQVIYNLLNNAINYSTKANIINIKQTVIDKKVFITFDNYGEKIPEDELPFIFDRYYRSKQNHVRAIAGSGLGLSIVRSNIRLHKGECIVKSNDEITSFTIVLPLG